MFVYVCVLHVPSLIFLIFTNLQMPSNNVQIVKDGMTRLRALLRSTTQSSARAVFKAWLQEIDEKTPRAGPSTHKSAQVATATIEEEGDSGIKDEEDTVDTLTSVAAEIQAHMLWIYRSSTADDLTEVAVGDVLGAQFFLTTRHTWNNEILVMAETEIFEIIGKLRREIVIWLSRARGPEAKNEAKEVVARILSGIYRTTLGEALDKLAEDEDGE